MRQALLSVIAGSSIVIAAAGCQISSSTLERITSRPSMPRSEHVGSATRLLYVADDESNSVRVYPAGVNNPRPVLKITDGVFDPQAMVVDAHGTLYVANPTVDDVTEYRSGTIHPFRTIRNGIQEPSGLAIDDAGTLYVGNRMLAAGEVFVSEYPFGSTSPIRTIVYPKHDFPSIAGLAVDSARNLYVMTSFSGGSGIVTKFAPGTTHGTNLGLKGIGNFGDGVGIDATGDLYVCVSTGAIDVYAPGAESPFRSVSSGLSSPAFFSVEPNGALFIPNQEASPNSSNVLEFAPNATRASFVINGFEYPTGTAISPASH